MPPSIGMLKVLLQHIKEYPPKTMVVDLVMVSTSGDVLAGSFVIPQIDFWTVADRRIEGQSVHRILPHLDTNRAVELSILAEKERLPIIYCGREPTTRMKPVCSLEGARLPETISSSKSKMNSMKPQRGILFSDNPTGSFALTKEELDELQNALPRGKKLTEGRTYIKRKSKRRAEYWACFMEYVVEEANGSKLLRAECKFCDKTFAADSNVNGSKNVKQHWERCIGNPSNKGRGKQTELFFEPGEVDKDGDEGDGKLKYGTVNLKEVRNALTYMTIVDELPFRHVEKDGFRHFVSVACPRFHIPSRSTVARDCVHYYLDEKEKLKDLFRNSCQRICVTTDTWTSIQRINYMCLTAHFLDNEWILHKRIINFCPISSHKGEAIGKAVESCLEAWNIEDKLFTVTVDNASSNDLACSYLTKMVQQSSGCISDGNNLHIRCMAHILNLIVWDGINEHIECIDRVRTAVRYIAAVLHMLTQWQKNTDEDLKSMAISMRKKYDKYWGKVEKMNMMIYMAVILDPHSKFVVLELTLNDMFGEKEGPVLAKKVKDFAYALFDEYRIMYSSSAPQSGVTNETTPVVPMNEDDSGGSMNYVKHLKDRAKRLKGTSGNVRTEFDRYLNEILGEDEESLPALPWWRLNGPRYPVVSRMARDILAIPLSTVASESAFSAGGRHLDSFRSSLSPKMVQNLICCQDWIRNKGTPTETPIPVEIEDLVREFEEVEKELDDEIVYVSS